MPVITPPFNEAKLEKIWANIALLEFRRQITASQAVEKMVDGVSDEYEDETGIDTAGSVDEAYDSTNDLYSPALKTAVVSQALNSSVDARLGDGAGVEYKLAQKITLAAETASIYSAEFYFGANAGSPTGNVKLTIQTESAGAPSGTLADASLTKDITHTPTAWNEFVFPSLVTLPAGSYWIVLEFLNNQTTNVSANLGRKTGNPYAGGDRAYHNGSWTVVSGEDLQFKLNTVASGMTLKSAAFAAAAQPSKGRIFLFEEDVDATTINTDLLAYISRDDGTTWTQVTLASLGLYETGKNIYGGLIDLSAQPSGTAMKYKIASANNKNFKLHGTALLWQ